MVQESVRYRETFQRAPLRYLNERMGKNGGTAASSAQLTLEPLLAAASKASGLTDFGNDDFRHPLDLLLQDFRADRNLHYFGNLTLQTMIKLRLQCRLDLKKTLDSEPGILKQPVSRPLIVLGLPRTGTTRLMRILARDPAHRPLRMWEAQDPSRPSVPGKERFDARRIRAMVAGRLMDFLSPDLQTIHPHGPDLPEECVGLLALAFDSSLLTLMHDAPRYQEWFLKSDHSQAYVEHKQQLQTLQWRHPERRWLLKSPGHMFGVADLMETYPDALIIQTHRDPSKALPSFASLAACMREPGVVRLDEAHIGRQILEQMQVGIANLERYVPKIPGDQYISIQYEDIVADPMSVVRSIYERFGLDLSPRAEAGFAAEIKQNPKDKKGKHVYTLEQFGYSRELIQKTFREYTEGNNIPLEG